MNPTILKYRVQINPQGDIPRGAIVSHLMGELISLRQYPLEIDPNDGRVVRTLVSHPFLIKSVNVYVGSCVTFFITVETDGDTYTPSRLVVPIQNALESLIPKRIDGTELKVITIRGF